jgi:hypothetical protein
VRDAFLIGKYLFMTEIEITNMKINRITSTRKDSGNKRSPISRLQLNIIATSKPKKAINIPMLKNDLEYDSNLSFWFAKKLIKERVSKEILENIPTIIQRIGKRKKLIVLNSGVGKYVEEIYLKASKRPARLGNPITAEYRNWGDGNLFSFCPSLLSFISILSVFPALPFFETISRVERMS